MNDKFGYCTDCNKHPQTVLDHATGDTICTDCGLVLDHHFIDETCEWRTFADSDDDNTDPRRVGSPSNPLLTLNNLSTTINHAMSINSKAAYDFVNSEKVLTKGFESIGLMADSLGIVKATKIRADEIYKNVVEKKALKGKKLNSVQAACLFISCKESNLPRTIKEICSAANGVSKKDINKAVEFIKKHIEVTQNHGLVNGSGLVRRFCSILGMKNADMKAAQEAIDNCQDFDIRRNPTSVLAAIIYIITLLSDQKVALQDIAKVVHVAEQTIKKSYKEIYPHALRVVPSWYANEDDFNKLPYPK